MEWDDPVYDKVGNILLSRIMGADVRLDPRGFDIGLRNSWEEARQQVEIRTIPTRAAMEGAGKNQCVMRNVIDPR